MNTASRRYLQPYLDAAAKYGQGFGTLLWASPKTQAVRFEALCNAVDLTGLHLLDVGCGRADLLEFLRRRRIAIRQYTGIEAVPDMADAADAKRIGGTIVRADFVTDPASMHVGADVVLFSGSLNTLDEASFYQAIEHACAAAREAVVFNFLCSPYLAGSPHLSWHPPDQVLAFARTLSAEVRLSDGYLKGDATVVLLVPSPGNPGEG